MSEQHYTIKEALEMEGVFGQTYDLTIKEVGDVKEYPKKDGSGKLKVQALKVSGGTADIKYSIFYPEREYEEGMGIQLTEAYIKEKGGYYDLRVAKAGTVEISESSNISTIEKSTEVKGDMGPTNEKLQFMWETMKQIWGTLELCEKSLAELLKIFKKADKKKGD